MLPQGAGPQARLRRWPRQSRDRPYGHGAPRCIHRRPARSAAPAPGLSRGQLQSQPSPARHRPVQGRVGSLRGAVVAAVPAGASVPPALVARRVSARSHDPAARGAGRRGHVPVRPLRDTGARSRRRGSARGAARDNVRPGPPGAAGHTSDPPRVEAPAFRPSLPAPEHSWRARLRSRYDPGGGSLFRRGAAACRGLARPDRPWRSAQGRAGLGREPAARQRPPPLLPSRGLQAALGDTGGRVLFPAKAAARGRCGGSRDARSDHRSRAASRRFRGYSGGALRARSADLRRYLGGPSRRRARAAGLDHGPVLSDWRWLVDRADTPWYPTMRLFRQTKRNDWKGTVSRVADALARLRA